MDFDERDQELVEQAYDYLTASRYPPECTENRKRVIRKKAKKFEIKDGELFYKQKQKGKGEVMLRFVQSTEEQKKVLQACHIDATAGHMGKTRTIYRIMERFMWHGMVKDVIKLISTCDVCQHMNRKMTTGTPELHPIPVKSPWHQIGIDFVGPLSPVAADGSCYIFTASDYFTKWVEAVPTTDKSASTVFKIFMRMGLPQVIISDQGRGFNNQLDSTLAELLGIKRRLTTPYHPQANGLDERWNQTLQNMLVKFVHSKKSAWHSFLETCAFAYNTSRHESTHFTPFELMFNRQATLPIDIELRKALPEEVASAYLNLDEPDIAKSAEKRARRLEQAQENILKAQQKQKEVYDKKHAKPECFKIGQLVLKKDFVQRKRKGGKLDIHFLGPYAITKILPHGTYQLTDVTNQKTIRVTGAHIKLYNTANPPLEDDPSASEANPSAPEDDPSASEANPSAPEDNPSAPEDDPSASEANPSAPEDDPSASEDNPSAPEDDLSASEDNPSAPEDDLSASEDNSPPLNDSIPPLPPPLPSLTELTQKLRERALSQERTLSALNLSSENSLPQSPHLPENFSLSSIHISGVTSSTPTTYTQGGFFPEFGPGVALSPVSTPQPQKRKPLSSTPQPQQRKPLSSTPQPQKRKQQSIAPQPQQRKPLSSAPQPQQRKPLSSTPQPQKRKPLSSTPQKRKPLSSTPQPQKRKQQSPAPHPQQENLLSTAPQPQQRKPLTRKPQSVKPSQNSKAKQLMLRKRQKMVKKSLLSDQVRIDVDKYTPKTASKMVKKVWLQNELFTLTKEDQSLICSKTAWLNDTVVNAAQSLLKQKVPLRNGFQDVCCGQTYSFDIESSEFTQVLHNGHGHWMVIGTIGSKEGEVLVYDSLYPSVSSCVKRQIAALLATEHENITLKMMDVQMQSETYDCGLFAIAFATALVHGEQPSKFLFNQDLLRRHLIQCLECGEMTMFPVMKIRRSAGRTKSEDIIEVHCSCRMPEIPDVEMIECSACSRWFHFPLCVSVPQKALNKRSKRYCSSCAVTLTE